MGVVRAESRRSGGTQERMAQGRETNATFDAQAHPSQGQGQCQRPGLRGVEACPCLRCLSIVSLWCLISQKNGVGNLEGAVQGCLRSGAG